MTETSVTETFLLWVVLLMKKLEIEKTKLTFVRTVLIVDITLLELVNFKLFYKQNCPGKEIGP